MHHVSWILIATVLASAPLARRPPIRARPCLRLRLRPRRRPPTSRSTLDGLRTAGRGIGAAQGRDRPGGPEPADTAQLRMAGQRLGGLCGKRRQLHAAGPRPDVPCRVRRFRHRTLARRLQSAGRFRQSPSCRPASAKAGRSRRPPRPPCWRGCATTRARCRNSGGRPCSRRRRRPRRPPRPHRLHPYCRDSRHLLTGGPHASDALRRRGLSPYFWPRFKQYVAPLPAVCAPRGPHVSRAFV